MTFNLTGIKIKKIPYAYINTPIISFTHSAESEVAGGRIKISHAVERCRNNINVTTIKRNFVWFNNASPSMRILMQPKKP